MKAGMTLEGLLTEVQRQSTVKRDFVASTKDAIRMVPMPGYPDEVALVLVKDEGELERFKIAEHTHRQIAGRLAIPWKFYFRLLTDHTDMVIDSVNKLFEREPKDRLIRTLDGTARGFLSDRYKRIDNDYILENTLPAIVKGDIETRLLSSNVGPDGNLNLKVLFTDDDLAIDLGPTARDGSPDIVHPGFSMRNDEVGKGKTSIKAFFYRSFCTNGCVFGTESAFDFSRVHLGGKLLEGMDYEVLSDRSKELEDLTIVSQIKDVMNALADRKFHDQLKQSLLAAKNTAEIVKPVAAMTHLAQEVGLSETEKDSALVNLISDLDYTKWGAVNAVTKMANSDDASYERACELEQIGADILRMNDDRWLKTAQMVEIAA